MTAARLDIVNINFLDWNGERPFRGGAERYVSDLAQLARSIGLQPRILQNAWRPFVTAVGGIEVVGVAAADRVDFAALSEGFAPHVADAALVIASPVELACALPASARVIGVNHGIWWDDPAGELPDMDPGRASLARALDRVRACVCVDTNFINWVRASGAGTTERLDFVPNYVELDRFDAPAKDFAGRLRVLFPRRLTRERGYAAALDAFDHLLPRHPDLDVEFCGGGGEVDEVRVREFVARHRGRATWAERAMDAMPAAYRDSHIVLIPTEYAEGTSLSCIEAMATNNAVVASHVGGLTNLVLDGYNGLLIKPGAAGIVGAIECLLADRELAAALAANALDVSKRFGRSRWQARWLALIGRVLGGVGQAQETAVAAAALPLERRPWHAQPGRDPERLAAALDDAAGARDQARDALRLVVAERDSARRAREQARGEEEAARRERDVAARDAQALRLERDLLWQQREQGILELAAMQGELTAVRAELASSRQELASSRQELASSRQERVDLQSTLVAVQAELVASRDERAALERTVVARDEGIVWLRDELRLAHERFARRRANLKLLGVDFGHAMFERYPALKRAVKTVVPREMRDRYNRASPVRYETSALTPGAGLAGTAGAIAGTMVPPRQAPAMVPAPPRASHGEVVAPTGYDVICLANIDWSARYQRPQHLMSRYAADGHRVFYVVASRTPPPGESYAIEPVAPNVWQVALAVDASQDFYGHSMTTANQAAMATALAALIADLRIKTAVTIVHLPYWAGLALELREHRGYRVVYDCMDEWEDFPAIGRGLLGDERRLVQAADLVTVTAGLLEQKWAPVARRCLLVRNGVDFEFFARNCIPNDLLAGTSRPIVGFYGALAEWMDLALIAECARARPDWTFVLAGDVFVKDLAGLDALPNVKLLGRRPYDEMPRLLYHFDVCLVPFKLNDVTHSVDPVKFYEYLSAGKPVVSVPLQEMAIYADYAYFATGADAFVAAIAQALQESDPGRWSRRVALARDNDWSARHRATVTAIEQAYPRVSIVIVSYFNAELTRLCVESIFATATYPNFEVIVVDNASTDDTRAYLRYLARTHDNVTVILNDGNRGFAAANNQGLSVAGGEYLVLLNNDTVVPRGWLEPLLAHLRDPAIGMVGPVTNFVGNEAKVDVDYASLDGMDEFAERQMRTHAGKIFDIGVLAMFCVAFTRATYERIGPLDEAFGVGMFEDDDYSRRVHAAGLRTVCAEDAFVHHFGQAAFKKLIETGEYQKLWTANQAHFERKWGEWKPHKHRE